MPHVLFEALLCHKSFDPNEAKLLPGMKVVLQYTRLNFKSYMPCKKWVKVILQKTNFIKEIVVFCTYILDFKIFPMYLCGLDVAHFF